MEVSISRTGTDYNALKKIIASVASVFTAVLLLGTILFLVRISQGYNGIESLNDFVMFLVAWSWKAAILAVAYHVVFGFLASKKLLPATLQIGAPLMIWGIALFVFFNNDLQLLIHRPTRQFVICASVALITFPTCHYLWNRFISLSPRGFGWAVFAGALGVWMPVIAWAIIR